MSKYLVRVSKKGPSAHVWTGSDTACRMWLSGGLLGRGVRLAGSQMGHRLCKLCAEASGVHDEPGDVPQDVNSALASLPVPPGCGFVDKKKPPKSESKKERKAKKAALLSAKLANRNNWKADRPARAVISHEEANSPEFLSSFAWRQLRMQVLQKYGRVCMCCGASPATGAVMHVDHIKPRRLFPQLALDIDNLQVLCHECNHGKGNWDQTDWRPHDDKIDPDVSAWLRSIAREQD